LKAACKLQNAGDIGVYWLENVATTVFAKRNENSVFSLYLYVEICLQVIHSCHSFSVNTKCLLGNSAVSALL